jgi:hypothetical protein
MSKQELLMKLETMVRDWTGREYCGDYDSSYDLGMEAGFRSAANELEALLEEINN